MDTSVVRVSRETILEERQPDLSDARRRGSAQLAGVDSASRMPRAARFSHHHRPLRCTGGPGFSTKLLLCHIPGAGRAMYSDGCRPDPLHPWATACLH